MVFYAQSTSTGYIKEEVSNVAFYAPVNQYGYIRAKKKKEEEEERKNRQKQKTQNSNKLGA